MINLTVSGDRQLEFFPPQYKVGRTKSRSGVYETPPMSTDVPCIFEIQIDADWKLHQACVSFSIELEDCANPGEFYTLTFTDVLIQLDKLAGLRRIVNKDHEVQTTLPAKRALGLTRTTRVE